MAASELRSFESEALQRDIWSAANVLRTAGLNPLETVEHVSLLLLLRLAEGTSRGLLGELRRLSPALATGSLYEAVAAQSQAARFFNEEFFPALRAAVDSCSAASPLRLVFDGFTPRIADDTALLDALALIERMSLDVEHVDVNGAMYEKLVGTISDAGFLGQYFTPRHVVDAMVELVAPQPGESVYDPAAGTGGFLIRAAVEERRSDRGASPKIFGREINATARRLCAINLIIHGIDPSHIEAGDSLVDASQVTDAFDVVLTNPPFGVTIKSPELLSAFPVPSRGAEALFVQHVVRALKPDGRAAIVCPEGLLTNVGHLRELREWLTRRVEVEAVLSFPGGVFLPYTGVRTGVVILRKGEPTKKIWFFNVSSDGFSLDVKRAATGQSDLPAAIRDFGKRAKSERSVLVSLKAVEKHDLRFVASRYLNEKRRRPISHPLVPLGEFADFRRAALSPSAHPDQEFFYIALEHIESRTGRLLNVERVPGSDLKSQKSQFCAGDVLYGKLRPYLAKATLAPQEGICSTEILVLIPDGEKADPGFLAHILRSGIFTDEATSLMVGANHPRLHPRDLLRIEIPLPDLEDQRELMAEAAELRAKIDDAAQAMMTLRGQLDAKVEGVWSA